MVDGIHIRGLSHRVGDFEMPPLDLDVKAGEYFVLTGPNGSGKSILLKLIAGLAKPLAGEVVVMGRDVTALPPWLRKLGYVPQDSLLFPNRTVERNIYFALEIQGMPLTKRRKIARDMAEKTGVAELLHRHPHGLSGGERQKVCIARALAGNPKVLLMDEPVSAVDEEARDGLCLLFKRLQREIGVTTIHVSHNQREAELVADRIGRMKNGAIVETRELESTADFGLPPSGGI